eukprot:COSAG06_NODE_3724_length_4973_cov_1.744973_1_plen_47_part_10
MQSLLQLQLLLLLLVVAAAGAAAAAGGWCPKIHTIANHYDPSGPIFV